MTSTSPKWHGTITALVTPMTVTGAIDVPALEALVHHQIDSGIEGLVACGTTGESATLNQQEWQQVVETVVRAAEGRVPVMAGAGTQATKSTIDTVKRAKGAGAQAALVVTPFYNKPTARGLRAHYEAIANEGGLPIMLYNVPSRTACDLSMQTVLALAPHPNIIGLKDATADLRRLDEGILGGPKNFIWLSGDDPTACAFTLMGGHGVISVVANVAPKAMAEMLRAAARGDAKSAQAKHRDLYGLMVALGLETNPIPIKTALALQGRIQDTFRAPLCSMTEHHRTQLQQALDAHTQA